MKTPRLAPHLVVAALLAAPWVVHAEAFHSGTVLASSMVGYAKPLSSNLSLRADWASLPGVERESIDEGVSYPEHLRSDRGLLFVGGHVPANMRLTGSMTFNRARAGLRTGGHGGSPLFGEVQYSTALNERFDVALRAPQTPPSLGASVGGNILLDIGGTFARASLSDRPSGPNLGAVSQTALDRELAQLRDGIGRARSMPPVSLGMHLRF